MGYGVTAHLITAMPDEAALNKLPKGLRWRAYRDDKADAWLVDVFGDDARSEKYPFTQNPFAWDAIGTPQDLQLFADVLSRLECGAPLGFFELNRILSEHLRQAVLSVTSDDEDLDCAVNSNNGAIERVEVEPYNGRIVWTPSGVGVRPLSSEEDDPDLEPGLDLESLAGLPGVTILPPGESNSLLHNLALQRERDFLSGRQSFLDLGSFDCLLRVPSTPHSMGPG